MGVRILESDKDGAVLYCSVSMWAFGPVFEDGDKAQAFLDWLETDARRLSDSELASRHSEWMIHHDK